MILFFFPCHAVDSDLHSFPTRRSSDLVPQPPHNYQPGYIPVAQPGTLPLRPLGLGDYFNSLFSTLRKSPGLYFGAALIFGGLAAILTATGEFLLSRSLGSLGWMDPAAQISQ